MYLHHFECGCILRPSKVARIKRGILICPEHKAYRTDTYYQCSKCGDSHRIEVLPQGREKGDCDNCCSPKRLASRKFDIVHKNDPSRGNPSFKPFKGVTRSDCKYYYDKCLLKACIADQEEPVDCTGCKRYEIQPLRIEDYIVCSDLFAEASQRF